MPKRPKSHQLEEKSWVALYQAIPSSWHLRNPGKDYGLDGLIEIYDDHDNSTGLMFFVQLKATDKKKLGPVRYPFEIETIKYYKSLPMPVLIVRYISNTNELYYLWTHNIDLYYAKDSKKTIAIHFKDKWSEGTAEIIKNQIVAIRQYSSSSIPLPISFQLFFHKENLFSTPSGLIESSIRDILANNKETTIKICGTTNIDPTLPKIEISEDLVFIDILGIMGSSLHLETEGRSDYALSLLPYQIMIGIAAALGSKGHYAIASELFSKYLIKSQFDISKIIKLLIISLKESRRYDLALKLFDDIINSDIKDFDLIETTFFQFLLFELDLGTAEFTSFERLFLMAVEKEIKLKRYRKIATWYYSFANKVRQGNRTSKHKAISYYSKAAKYDGNYKKRDYFYSEIAGILFLLDKFNCSSQFYKKAYELGCDKSLLVLRADALMFAGNYLESYELFDEYEKKVGCADSEWILKKWALSKIIERGNINKQSRKVLEAFEPADITKVPEEKAEEAIKKSLGLDYFCGLAWFNIGVVESKKKNFKEAFTAFLIAGLSQPNDTESWANTIICLMNNRDNMELLPHILSVAYKINGESFYRCLSDKINKQIQMSSEEKSTFVNIINECLIKLSKANKESRIIRLINEDGSYKIIE
ncbi:MAG: DUF4365 domain-containing protein [Elusimicrobia bacterium]|nr:DUF4365 domain-containing protein [Elusimicrobiota bacterium]